MISEQTYNRFVIGQRVKIVRELRRWDWGSVAAVGDVVTVRSVCRCVGCQIVGIEFDDDRLPINDIVLLDGDDTRWPCVTTSGAL